MDSIELLEDAKRDILALEKEQDKIYKESLRALKIKPTDEPKSTILFDYLFNKGGSAKKILDRIKK